MRPGDVACGSDFIDTRENKRTAFYSEWVRPQGYLHEMGGLLEARADFSAMLFVARGPGQRPFGMSERESFRVVIPHVRTALALSCRLQAGQQGELARSALAQRGWIALRHDAGVMLMEGPLVERRRVRWSLPGPSMRGRTRLCSVNASESWRGWWQVLRRALAHLA